MSELVKPLAEWCAAALEVIGVLYIVLSAFGAVFFSLIYKIRKIDPVHLFRQSRQILGRGILLGLEFLVAADIIHTVAVDLTFSSIGVLSIIVLIRTFLSFTLEVEITGNWPWQTKVR